MGRLLGQKGEFRQAEEHIHRAQRLAPGKVQAHYLLGLLLFKQGEMLSQTEGGDHQKARQLFEQSAASARQALAVRSDYGFAHMVLGLSLKALGRRPEALAAFREAVHCNPEYADNHFFLGLMLAEDGKLGEARPYLEQARLLAAPDDARPRIALEKYFPGSTSKGKR